MAPQFSITDAVQKEEFSVTGNSVSNEIFF